MLLKLLLAGGVILLGILINQLLLFRKQLQKIRYYPGTRCLLSPATLLGTLMPKTKNEYINPGAQRSWTYKRKVFDEYKSSIISFTALNDPTRSFFKVSSPSAARILALDRNKFLKPVQSYRILAIFGDNVLTTEGEEWKKHRKIVAPGFGERVFELVWMASTGVVGEMIAGEGLGLEVGEGKDVEDMTVLTLKLALAVLARASFGTEMTWDGKRHPVTKDTSIPTKEDTARPLHQLTLGEAITTVSEKIIWLLASPKILFKLPVKSLQHIGLAADELRSIMKEMIIQRRAELKSESEHNDSNGDGNGAGEGIPQRRDLFNQLIENSGKEFEDEKAGKGGVSLTDEELIGNIFIFALAGHETSAHTLAFVFSLLALYPEKQEWMRGQILEIMPEGHTPTYKDFNRLTRVMAVLNETLRLFPAVIQIPKYALEDTFLPDDDYSSGSPVPGEKMVFIPKGSMVDIDTVGLHRHPAHWQDPDDFKPERFMEDYNKDAFMPFSAGPRACIGRRFAEVESVCMIALLVRLYEFSPTVVAGETHAQTSERLLKASSRLTLTPLNPVSLTMKRRAGEINLKV